MKKQKIPREPKSVGDFLRIENHPDDYRAVSCFHDLQRFHSPEHEEGTIVILLRVSFGR